MKTALKIFGIVTAIIVSGCHKTTLADCSFSTNKTCSDLRQANDNRMAQLSEQEGRAAVAAEQARMNATVAPPADYQDMTKGLPKPK